jgi:hypothetical protein
MPPSLTNACPAETTCSGPRQQRCHVSYIEIPIRSVSPHAHGRYSHSRSLHPSIVRVIRWSSRSIHSDHPEVAPLRTRASGAWIIRSHSSSIHPGTTQSRARVSDAWIIRSH